MTRGALRILLGAAPGVGKTSAMLREGRQLAAAGTDVVLGVLEVKDRYNTAAEIGDLEFVPRRRIAYRDRTLAEMDVDAILSRRPQVALVDELAHINVPGSRNEKRWQDIDELIVAGVSVISTVNIHYLESLNTVVERITGVHQRATVADAWVRAADDVQLVELKPWRLRRRFLRGELYAPEKMAAVAPYFRRRRLAALQDLANHWMATEA
jgi:two-component system, OmpR family, sensor histidine kinase KdpD